MTEGLTKRQREILSFIEDELRRRGIPPTVREVAARFGFASTNAADGHLKALERKGYITRAHGLSRGVMPVRGVSGEGEAGRYPVVGEVAAGIPALAVQSDDEQVSLDEAAGARPGDFLLRVKGYSMSGAGINPGDMAVVRPRHEARDGEIVVVMVGSDEATLKRIFTEKDGKVRLVPENPAFDEIIIDPRETPVKIVGKVVGVVRRY